MAKPDGIVIEVQAAYQRLSATSKKARCVVMTRSGNGAVVNFRFASSAVIPLPADRVLPFFWQTIDLYDIEVAGTAGDYVDVVYAIPEIGGLDVGR